MILTSAARVKKGPQWCEEADTLAATLIETMGTSKDSEIAIGRVMLDTIGLANTLVALGTPHPRFKKQAEQVLEAYLQEVYAVVKSLADKLGVEFVDLKVVINNPRRLAQAKQLRETLRHLQYSSYDPVLDYLFMSMRYLLSEESNSNKAIYAGKQILAAWKLVDSDYDAYGELAEALNRILESV